MLHLGLSLDFASAKLVIICRITNVFAKYFLSYLLILCVLVRLSNLVASESKRLEVGNDDELAPIGVCIISLFAACRHVESDAFGAAVHDDKACFRWHRCMEIDGVEIGACECKVFDFVHKFVHMDHFQTAIFEG